jgi:hypothetical protein
MSKLSTLANISQRSRTEMQLIDRFASESDASLKAKASKLSGQPFPEHERDELGRLAKAMFAAADNHPKGGSIDFSMHVSERVANYVMQVITPIKQQTFLAEMALAYLVSHVEAFIKDYVEQVLVDNPRMLRNSGSITQEEALSFSSMKALRRGLANKEVEALGYGSIDEVAVFFQKRLGIGLASFEKWDLLREHAYRRNLIIHNQSRVNDTYRKKVKYTGRHIRLHTDMTYVSGAAGTMLAFVDYVHAQVIKKFKLAKESPTN